MNCGGNTVLPNPNVLLSPNLAKVSCTKKVQQSRNFTTDEDILLISVCLHMDTGQGNQQKSSTYWKKIHDHFHEQRKFDSIRSQDSLKHRWSRIKDDVEKFSKYYAKIEGRQQSDLPEHDKIFEAMKLYEKKQGHPFQLQHCWKNLRDHPKWAKDPSKKNTEISKNVSSTMSFPSIADPIHFGEDDTANDESANLERPIDHRKAQKREYESSPCTHQHPINLREDDDTGNVVSANLERSIGRKAQKKECVSSGPTSMFSVRMQHERLAKLYSDYGELINLEKEIARRYVLEDEERIMEMDTTSMHPKAAQYYESRQREILAQRNGTGFH